MRDRAAVDAAIAAVVREFGRLDIVLELAGISHRLNFLDLDAGTWDRIIAVNLTGMFHLGQAAARQMVRQGEGGSIINVTSQLAEVARPERAAYVASKGGARSLTHAMAVDLAAHGIRVNAIAPGPTLTGLTRASYTDPENRRATEALIPLGRLGQPDDLVGAVLFLASDEFALGDRQHGHRGRRLSGDLRGCGRTAHRIAPDAGKSLFAGKFRLSTRNRDQIVADRPNATHNSARNLQSPIGVYTAVRYLGDLGIADKIAEYRRTAQMLRLMSDQMRFR